MNASFQEGTLQNLINDFAYSKHPLNHEPPKIQQRALKTASPFPMQERDQQVKSPAASSGGEDQQLPADASNTDGEGGPFSDQDDEENKSESYESEEKT